MNDSRERYHATVDEWARSAIRNMLRSPDPIAVYGQQDPVIKDRIKSRLGQYRRPSLVVLVLLVLVGLGAIIVIPFPLAVLPMAGVLFILVVSWRESRLARLKDQVLHIEVASRGQDSHTVNTPAGPKPNPPSLTRHFIDRCFEVGPIITIAAFIYTWFDDVRRIRNH